MLKLFKIEQRKGKQRRGGPMGVYANGAALRAMAAVEQVHLVVISTFTGPSAGKGFKGHGRVIKGRPFDRVAVYPPNDGRPLRRFKSWANDIVPVLLMQARSRRAEADRPHLPRDHIQWEATGLFSGPL